MFGKIKDWNEYKTFANKSITITIDCKIANRYKIFELKKLKKMKCKQLGKFGI